MNWDDFTAWLGSSDSPSAVAVVLALLVFVAGWVLGVIARRGVIALTKRMPGVSEQAGKTIARVVKYLIIFLGLGVALTFLGAPIQPLLAVTIIVVVVLALSLRGLAENFGAGVIIQTRHPYRVGHDIETNGHRGIVQEINGRTTILRTSDGLTVHVPNAAVLSEPFVDYTEAHGGRDDVEVRVNGERALASETRALLTEAASSVGSVRPRPPVAVLLMSATRERATYYVRVWHGPDERESTLDAVATALADAVVEHDIEAVVVWPPTAQPFTPPPAF